MKNIEEQVKSLRFAITDNTTYTGKDAYEFYSKSLLKFVSAPYMTLVPNVKSKIKLPTYDIGNLIQEADCSWNAAGEGTLDQKAFEVCDLKVQLQYCVTTFEQNFLNEVMRPGFTGEIMPAVFESYVIDQIAAKAAQDMELIAWQGDTGTSSYPLSKCDGLVKKFKADGTVVDVTATASITVTNVIGEIQKVYNAIPNVVWANKEDLKIFVPISVAKLYRQAVANASAEAYFVGDRPLNFLGVEIVETHGLPNLTMVAARVSNILFLTDLLSDLPTDQSPTLINMLQTTGEPNLRFFAFFKAGFDYKIGAEVVLYS